PRVRVPSLTPRRPGAFGDSLGALRRFEASIRHQFVAGGGPERAYRPSRDCRPGRSGPTRTSPPEAVAHYGSGPTDLATGEGEPYGLRRRCPRSAPRTTVAPIATSPAPNTR